MNRPQSYLAGGALALLMSSVSAFAMSANPAAPHVKSGSRAAIVLAQAECPEGQECAPAAEAPADEAPAEAKPRRKKQAEAEEPAEARPAAEQPAEEPAEAKPRRKREQPTEAQAEPQAEQPAEAPAEAKPRRKKQAEPAAEERPAEQPAEAQPEPQAEQPAEAPAEAKPRRKKDAQPAAEQPAEQPAEAQPEPKAEQPAEAPAEAKPRRKKDADPAAEKPAEQPAEAKPEKPATAEQPADAPTPAEKPADQPAETPTPAEKPAEQPAETPAQGETPAQSGENKPEGKAPVLDSQKPAEATQPPADGTAKPPVQGEAPPTQPPADGQQAQPTAPAEPAGPPPTDDKAAQEAVQPREIVPVTQERGERRRERPRVEDRERPEGAEVVRKLGDRLILNFNNTTIVESDDRERMGRGAREVYYEDLPRGRTREVIMRPNGNQVVTIRNRNGDIIRRSRITPEGREIVLVYVDEDNFDRVREWRDPGADLPPMRLDIPEEEYILDAETVEDPDAYYEFLSEPPVEKVERLYSVDEVKRSARIRDKTRRIDLDSITFEFGKAEVPEDQVKKLEGVAQGMEKLLQANPAESFLIEGHTDAVGTDVANLALSDRRAEAVASALTDVFGIPPENLNTQGYGEQYLKVRTEEPDRENRRVAIRRITPLVAPVASAQ